tara:strand:- start:2888 stop:3442 length:555 start_codon:yes stop_codon:yes gene_type:complete
MKLRAQPKLRISESRLQRLIEVMVRSILQEKAKSKNQQEFMGMVHACKKSGYKDCASKEVEDVARNMKAKDAEDFASTSHKGLPEKIDETRVASTHAASAGGGHSGSQGGPMQRFGIDSQPSVEEQFLASIAEFFGGDRDQAKDFLKTTKSVGFEQAAAQSELDGDDAYQLMKMISGRDLNAES